MKIFFHSLLIIALLGICVCEYRARNYKTFAIAIAFAVGNSFVFFWK